MGVQPLVCRSGSDERRLSATAESLEKQHGVGALGRFCLRVTGFRSRVHLLGAEDLQNAHEPLRQELTGQIQVDLRRLGAAIRRDEQLAIGFDRLKDIGHILKRCDDGASIECC